MPKEFDESDIKDELLEVERLKESNIQAAVYLQLAAERGMQILEMEKEIKELKEIYITVLMMNRVGLS